MSDLKIKSAGECALDMVGLGELMVRLEPMPRGCTAANATHYKPWVGGGEINPCVAASVLGMRTGAVSAFPDHDLANWAMGQLARHGVSTAFCNVVQYDKVGRTNRQGLYFCTPGDSIRKNKVVYDRGHSASAAMKPGDIDWKALFSKGVRVFHTGGIYAALSESTPAVMGAAMSAASDSGAFVTYDLNMREHMWQGDLEKAKQVNQSLAKHVNGMFGNESDFQKALGVEASVPDDVNKLDITDTRAFESLAKALLEKYPNISLVGRSMRNEKTSTLIDWGGMICVREKDGPKFYKATPRYDLHLVERTGGGDSFYCGVMYAFLQGWDAQKAVEFGAALAALKQANAGDTLQPGTTVADVENEIVAAQTHGARRTDR